jgi:site-specific DNA recombinase
MRVAIYARVSTEAQEARGTIGSQCAALRERAAAEGHELVAEFLDDGHSGARLDRPGLDALRDAAEAGLLDAVWCLSPDRLARVYAYQVIVLDELARHGVAVLFADAPALDDDPQARLLTQVQGVIAEYERAKIAERYRRGKLWRARAGEVISWKAPYGFRRLARSVEGPPRLVPYEPEVAVVRRIFDDYVAGGHSTREISRRLNADGVPTPTGAKAVWGTSTIGRLLRNEAYVGRVYYNRTESVPDPRPGRGSRQVPRPREEWIEIPVPPIISEDVFEAASRVSRDNSKWSPRNTDDDAWLLRELVRCGQCNVGVSCHKMRGRNGAFHRYYYCRNHDPLRAGGEERRCRERNIRSDELDRFVFDQVRQALLRPDVLLAGECAVAARAPAPDDELLGAQLARLDRRATSAEAERRRLVDLYQAGMVELVELQRRARELDARRRVIDRERQALAEERETLAKDNRLRRRIGSFAERITAAMDSLDFGQRQKLLRLVIEQVRVTGWDVEIRLRVPLDERPLDAPPPSGADRGVGGGRVSTEDRLRSLGGDDAGVVDQAVDHGGGHRGVAEHLTPPAERLVGAHDEARPLVAGAHELEEEVGRLRLERDVAHLVTDEQRDAPQPVELLVELPCAVGDAEAVHPLPGGGEGDPVAGLAGPDADGDRQMRLARPRRPEEDRVGPRLDEVERAEVGHHLSSDRALVVEVELLERLVSREAGRPDAVLAAVGLPGGHLPLEAGGQDLFVGPALSAGPLSDALDGGEQRRCLERAAEVGDVGGRRAHDATPRASS